MSATSEKPLREIPEKYINPLHAKGEDEGPRVNGKNWKISKDAFRLRSAGVRKLNTWKARSEKKLQEDQIRARIKDLKQEKSDEKTRKVEEIKKRHAAIEEKARFERIAQKMHAKKVDRLRRKEKRNKLLRERKNK